jgi:uncharacterized membrane protein YgcG
MTLRTDGSMHVKETITYDFDDAYGKHGIQRFIPIKVSYDTERNRVYPLTNARASSPSGAPDDLDVSSTDVATLRVGNKNETVSGVQTYVLDYDLGGVINTVGGGQELYWNAVGTEWEVPIDAATVTVTGPGPVQRDTCFQGGEGSTQPCRVGPPSQGSNSGSSTATFTATRGLAANEGVTVVVGYPAGTFPSAVPILKEKWKFTKAFGVNPVSGIGSVGLLAVLGGGAVLLAGRGGRDRRYLGLTPGLTPGVDDPGRTGTVGWRRDPIAVQFTPPHDLRVGELGTLIDEQANVVDVTATIIDLAVRGYLKIEEVGKASDDEASDDEGVPEDDAARASASDWLLVRTRTDTGDLRGYEKHLFGAIFQGRKQVKLSDLRTTFSAALAKTQSLLYDDVTEQGWFRGNPGNVRIKWRSFAGTTIGVGVALTVLLAIFTHWALIGVALVVCGGILMLTASRMPARTASGTALLAQARGFRLYLETAEANQIKFEEGQDIFSRYLPYAIVFGVAQRWAGLFAELARSGAQILTPTWYIGQPYGAGPFDYNHFGGSMSAFSTETSSTIQAAAPSSASGSPGSSGSSGFSGGFSGGGGGGGGGGSW